MTYSDHKTVSAGLADHLNRLWRYGLVLSGNQDTAHDLVQATCLRALEKSHQFEEGSRLDRWLFSILNSIWKNQLRAQKVRQGQGFVSAEDALLFDGAQLMETNITARQVLSKVQALPEAQRETVFLVYVEGYSYAEAAEILAVPMGTIMSRLAAARKKLSGLKADDGALSAGEAREG